LDHSSCSLEQLLVDQRSSPSQQAMRGEQSLLVAAAMSRLPDDYQQVLVLRHLEGLTFPQVALRMERSVDSVEKLWLRGLTRLKKEFGEVHP
jgi:RNA polymerase sigma-70 factor (ECF subfamily)